MWDEGELDHSGWSFQHEGAYLGNEGNEEESVFSRYILTFCRRGAMVPCQTGKLEERDCGLDEGTDGETIRRQEPVDLEEQLRQRNAACDARGMAKY